MDLSFFDKKQFNALLRHFCVSVKETVADAVAQKKGFQEDAYSVMEIDKTQYYSDDYGLSNYYLSLNGLSSTLNF